MSVTHANGRSQLEGDGSCYCKESRGWGSASGMWNKIWTRVKCLLINMEQVLCWFISESSNAGRNLGPRRDLPASEGLLVGQHTHASMFSLFGTSKTYIKLLKQVNFLMTFIVLLLQVHVTNSFPFWSYSWFIPSSSDMILFCLFLKHF